MPTRSAEIFSWDTSKLLEHVLKNDKTLLPNKRTRLIRRVQDKNSRWAILKYTIWESRSGPLKRIVLSLWLYDFKAEFELRRDTAKRLISRISEILYKVDPADLAAVDAPRDEYNPEAEWIADRIFIGREDLSLSMIKDVFESLFSKGTGSDELFQTATAGIDSSRSRTSETTRYGSYPTITPRMKPITSPITSAIADRLNQRMRSSSH